MIDRVYYECDTCSYGTSGDLYGTGIYDRCDAHEAENHGHRMVQVTE